MTDKIFIDSNIWIYLYLKEPSEKYLKSFELVKDNFNKIVISTQVLSEVYVALTKKYSMPKEKTIEIMLEMISAFKVVDIDVLSTVKTFELCAKNNYSYWDNLIISAALLAKCHVLYSEDMQHGQTVEKHIKIINPLI